VKQAAEQQPYSSASADSRTGDFRRTGIHAVLLDLL
jgi:hypothetical protein